MRMPLLLIINWRKNNNENLKIYAYAPGGKQFKLTLKGEWFIICNMYVIICGCLKKNGSVTAAVMTVVFTTEMEGNA